MTEPINPEFGFEISKMGPADLTKEYRRFRNQFRDLVKRAIRVSRGSGGIWVEENRLAYSSVLFTRICARAKSLDTLLPDCKPGSHWDFSSVASLTRNLAEAYFWYSGFAKMRLMLTFGKGALFYSIVTTMDLEKGSGLIRIVKKIATRPWLIS